MTATSTGAPAHEDRHQHPWLGLMSYGEQDHGYFFGRDREADELFRQVQRETLTVVFGVSGTGKTSLLNAGLFPRMREQHILPVRIRIDYGEGAAPPAVQVRQHIARAIADHDMDEELVASAHLPESDETLWEYMHRVEIWDRRNQPITPALVFDQFEEIFTLGRDRPESRDLLTELADLVENRVPEKVRAHLDATGGRLALPADKQHYKILIAMREDFVPRLDDLKKQLPSVMRNRFKLSRMNGTQAMTAVTGPGRGIVDDAVAQRIVRFVAAANVDPDQQTDDGSGDLSRLEIEPALLSVVCRELNQRRLDAGESTITTQQVEASQSDILTDFYDRSYAGLGDHVRVFVEDNLLTSGGFRRAVPREDAINAGLNDADIAHLVDRRLLRVEEHLQQPHLELSHDLLTGVVQESRDVRHERERETEHEQQLQQERAERRRARRRRVTTVALLIALVVLPVLGWLTFEAHRLRGVAESESRRADDRADAAQIAEGEARQAEAQATVNLSRALYLTARGETQSGRQGRALAYLSQSLNLNPENRASAHMLLWLATTRNWLLPAIDAIRIEPAADGAPHHAAFSPRATDGRVIVAADNRVQMWSAQTGRSIDDFGPLTIDGRITVTTTRMPKGNDQPVLYAAGSDTGRVMVWNLDTGETLLDASAAPDDDDAPRHIAGIDISPNGQYVAVGTAAGEAVIFNIAEQSLIRRLPHRKLLGADADPTVRVVAFRPRDQKPELMTVVGREFVIWNWQQGALLLSGRAKHEGAVMTARYSLTDTQSFDDQIFTFDDRRHAYSWRVVTTFSTADRREIGASNPLPAEQQTHPTAAPAIDGLEANDLRLDAPLDNVKPQGFDNNKPGYIQYYTVTVAPLATFKDRRVTSIATDPTDDNLVVGFDDGSISLWSIGTLYEKAVAMSDAEPVESYRSSPSIPPHTGEVTASAWDQTGMRIATGSSDGAVNIYGLIDIDPESIQCEGDILSLNFSRDGKQLIIASADGGTYVWNILPGHATAEPMYHAAHVQAMATSSDGRWLATCDGTSLRVWDRSNSALLWQQDKSYAHVAFIDDQYLVAATNDWDAAVEIWPVEPAPENYAQRLVLSNAPIVALRVAGDAARFATVSNGRVRVFAWDAPGKTMTEIDADPVRDADLTDARLSPDGRWVAVFSSKSAALSRLTRLADEGEPVTYELSLGAPLLDLVFSPDSTWFAAAGKDRTARLWQLDPQGGEPQDTGRRLQHRDWIFDLAISDDGRRIATASRDATVAVWNVEDASQLTVIEHAAAVPHVDISHDGSTVLTLDVKGNHVLYDIDSGLPLTTNLAVYGMTIHAAMLDRHRHQLIVASDTLVQQWDCPYWDGAAPGWLRELGVAAGGYDVNERGIAVPVRDHFSRASALRDEITAISEDSPALAAARWVLADRRTRTISHQSSITVSQYVDNRIAEARHAIKNGPYDEATLLPVRNALYRCLTLTPDNRDAILDVLSGVTYRLNR